MSRITRASAPSALCRSLPTALGHLPTALGHLRVCGSWADGAPLHVIDLLCAHVRTALHGTGPRPEVYARAFPPSKAESNAVGSHLAISIPDYADSNTDALSYVVW